MIKEVSRALGLLDRGSASRLKSKKDDRKSSQGNRREGSNSETRNFISFFSPDGVERDTGREMRVTTWPFFWTCFSRLMRSASTPKKQEMVGV
jgi:hypothetical protein